MFSSQPYLGNPLAVIHDAGDLTSEQMQAVARWTNLSETVFLLPPANVEADYRVRIFTPRGELPFAGHPTLGSAHAWIELGGCPRDPGLLVQECEVGMVKVRRDGAELSFAAPPTTRSGDLDEDYLAQIADAFGIDRAQVVGHQWVDNGPGWAVVRMSTVQEVLDLDPDLTLVPSAMIGALAPYPEGSAYAYELRTFAPAVGVPEDPVCGSMNASIGQWLARIGEAGSSYRVSQGSKLGRVGEIVVTVDAEGGVWVGGGTQTMFRGTALI